MLKRSRVFNFISPFLFHIITGVALVIFFIILEPRTAGSLFPIKTQILFGQFIKKTLLARRIDPQEFWQTREFACPGYFTVHKQSAVFSTYTCPRLQSIDRLISSSTLSVTAPHGAHIILQTNQTLIYEASDKLVISFILSNSQMQKAVGFFDYAQNDKELTKDKNWFDFTVVDKWKSPSY
ncbi:hypothetical protein HY214_01555 [Candidatus Roizmanbacteria bacterium]|nr:hypothetical protein [Candidatus Roizmanbacteria bacterium]